MDYAALRSLIVANPNLSKWLDEGRDADIAEALNLRNQRGHVPIREISAVALDAGLYGQCEVQIRKSITPESEAVHRLAFDTLTLLRDDYRLESANVDTDRFQHGLVGYVSLGWLTQGHADAISALAENRSSLAEIELGSQVTYADVSAARLL